MKKLYIERILGVIGILLGILLLQFLNGCRPTYKTCRAAYPCPDCPPTLVIDSTFVIDTVAVIDSVRVYGAVNLDSIQGIFRKVYEDSLFVIKMGYTPNIFHSGKNVVSYEVVAKERKVKIKAANADSLIHLIRLYKGRSDSMKAELHEMALQAKDLQSQINEGPPVWDKWWFGSLMAFTVGFVVFFGIILFRAFRA